MNTERPRKGGGWEIQMPCERCGGSGVVMFDGCCEPCQGTGRTWRRLLPITFTAANAERVHAGAKTQTRRLFKFREGVVPTQPDRLIVNEATLPSLLQCARYRVGDVLWIQEPWRTLAHEDSTKPTDLADNTIRSYEGTELVSKCDFKLGKLRPGRFLPLRFARPGRYEVTAVRVERVNEISEADARAEGIVAIKRSVRTHGRLDCYGWEGTKQDEAATTPVFAFADLWDSIHKAPGTRFEDGPWVFANTLKKVT